MAATAGNGLLESQPSPTMLAGPSRSRFQKRVDVLVREREDAKREAAQFKAEAEKLKGELARVEGLVLRYDNMLKKYRTVLRQQKEAIRRLTGNG